MTILGCSFLDLYTEYIVMAQTPNAKHPYSSCHHTVTLAFGSSAKRLCGHGVQLSFIPMQSLQRSKNSQDWRCWYWYVLYIPYKWPKLSMTAFCHHSCDLKLSVEQALPPSCVLCTAKMSIQSPRSEECCMTQLQRPSMSVGWS